MYIPLGDNTGEVVSISIAKVLSQSLLEKST